MARRIIAALMLTLTLALTFVPTFAEEAIPLTDLDMTTIEEDFTGKDGANFDTQKFIDNLEDKTKPEIAVVREYWQRFKVSSPITWLYIYVYVPYGITNGISVTPNNFEFGLLKSFVEDGVSTSIEYLDGYIVDSTDDCNFLKLKINVTGLYTITDSKRMYSIAGIKGFNEDNLILDVNYLENCEVRNYYFSGSDEAGNLDIEFEYEKVLNLDTQSTVFRTPTSDKGIGYQYDIFSVYFTIPKYYIEKYDGLQSITYKHTERTWNAVVVDNHLISESLTRMYGETFSNYREYREDFPSIYVRPSFIENSGFLGGEVYHELYADFAVNPDEYLGVYEYLGGNWIEQIVNFFCVDDWRDDDLFISESYIVDKINKKQDGSPSSEYVGDANSEDLFDINSFSGEDPGLFTRLTKWYYYDDLPEIQATGVNVVEFFNDMSVFEGHIENVNDEDYANKLFIDKSQIDDFKTYLKKATTNGDTVCLLRFAIRDYYSAEFVYYEKGVNVSENPVGFFCFGSCFDGFRIISLNFKLDGLIFKVLVNDEPKDISGGITGPTYEAGSGTLGGFFNVVLNLGGGSGDSGVVSDIIDYLMIILGVILLLFLFVILSPFIRFLCRVIGSLFKSLFKKRKNNNDRKDE